MVKANEKLIYWVERNSKDNHILLTCKIIIVSKRRNATFLKNVETKICHRMGQINKSWIGVLHKEWWKQRSKNEKEFDNDSSVPGYWLNKWKDFNWDMITRRKVSTSLNTLSLFSTLLCLVKNSLIYGDPYKQFFSTIFMYATALVSSQIRGTDTLHKERCYCHRNQCCQLFLQQIYKSSHNGAVSTQQ